MKLVRFNRDMRPFARGDTRIVPDAVADQLVAQGDAEVTPSVFDNQAPDPAPIQPRPRALRTRSLL